MLRARLQVLSLVFRLRLERELPFAPRLLKVNANSLLKINSIFIYYYYVVIINIILIGMFIFSFMLKNKNKIKI